MGVLDKAKAAAEQATTKAKEGVADVQTKRKLTQAYGELGQTTFELVQTGEVVHPRLTATVERVRELKAQLEREQREGEPPPSATDTPPPLASETPPPLGSQTPPVTPP